jgi:hypothetical protein
MPLDEALVVLGDRQPNIDIQDLQGRYRQDDGTFKSSDRGWDFFLMKDHISVRLDGDNRVRWKMINIDDRWFFDPPRPGHWWDRLRAWLGW